MWVCPLGLGIYANGTTTYLGGDGNQHWTSLSPLNGWSDPDPPRAGYLKDSNGFVHLRGQLVAPHNTNSIAFTLPSGFRPSADTNFGLRTQATITDYFHIASDGNAYGFPAATSTAFMLDGITFDTR